MTSRSSGSPERPRSGSRSYETSPCSLSTASRSMVVKLWPMPLSFTASGEPMVSIKQLRARQQELASFEGNLSKGEREQLAKITRFLSEHESHVWKRENSIARRT